MFWKKKESPRVAQRSTTSLDSPRPVPILKTAPDHGQGSPSIRFAGNSKASSSSHPAPPGGSPLYQSNQPINLPSPRVHVQPSQSPQRIASPTPVRHPMVPIPPLRMPQPQRSPLSHQGPRRSSRPTSPRSSSFSTTILSTLPNPLTAQSHITTPPTAYVSAMHSRAPPPPSPYRPTTERRVSALGEHLDEYSRPRNLFDTPSAPGRTVSGEEGLPTFNIIPATPQTYGEEWNKQENLILQESSQSIENRLETAFKSESPLETGSEIIAPPKGDDGMETSESIPESLSTGSLPEIGQFEFSPFEVPTVLPSVDSVSSVSSLPYSLQPSESQQSVPPESPEEVRHSLTFSPPFESYPSLPSLDSNHSLAKSASSMKSSNSESSLASYGDVEEALGTMLASLSDPSMPLVPSIQKLEKFANKTGLTDTDQSSNPGLGLGLSLPPSITAPLSTRRKKSPPPPLDLSLISNLGRLPSGGITALGISFDDHHRTSSVRASETPKSAPARVNHRTPFYQTAKIHPNSPTSGIFIHQPTRSVSDLSLSETPSSRTSIMTSTSVGYRDSLDLKRRRDERVVRDSISLASECSDDDLHTASIVCLTPVRGGLEVQLKGSMVSEERLADLHAEEVGLAF